MYRQLHRTTDDVTRSIDDEHERMLRARDATVWLGVGDACA
jgi:hypothetical protein